MTDWMFVGVAVFWCVSCGLGYYWSHKRMEHRDQKRTKAVTISGTFHTGGLISLAADGEAAFRAFNQAIKSITPLTKALTETVDPVVLEETWSPDKIVAWRVIPVQVDHGDPDGLWLGFPHPDGPTEPVVMPRSHPVGEELKAECREPVPAMWPSYMLTGWDAGCGEPPGENCASAVGYGCGYYAYKTKEQAEIHMVAGEGQAIACVHLSGKVIEHEGGYRAEILEVLEVETPPAPPDNVTVMYGSPMSGFQGIWVGPGVSGVSITGGVYKGGT